ncbi:hypothetical protein [Luteibacter sp. 22Crub2.1]|uniref:hypothetical protein n=1 Tax=Luteibacter sp. 22Crub2.1 TaxID=1283288 RepID=UPI0020CA3E39|nr:hypothetical protein [Luteibacter sp. 22Crub2.1]
MNTRIEASDRWLDCQCHRRAVGDGILATCCANRLAVGPCLALAVENAGNAVAVEVDQCCAVSIVDAGRTVQGMCARIGRIEIRPGDIHPGRSFDVTLRAVSQRLQRSHTGQPRLFVVFEQDAPYQDGVGAEGGQSVVYQELPAETKSAMLEAIVDIAKGIPACGPWTVLGIGWPDVRVERALAVIENRFKIEGQRLYGGYEREWREAASPMPVADVGEVSGGTCVASVGDAVAVLRAIAVDRMLAAGRDALAKEPDGDVGRPGGLTECCRVVVAVDGYRAVSGMYDPERCLSFGTPLFYPVRP